MLQHGPETVPPGLYWQKVFYTPNPTVDLTQIWRVCYTHHRRRHLCRQGSYTVTQNTSEVPLIPDSDLAALQSFNSRGRITLSAYLRLDTPQHRDSALDEFLQQIRIRLAECDPQPECREAIQEDMEIVSLYLKTNGHRRHAGLAIFSCAAELFWRAYPLSVAVPTQVMVGPVFNIEPLRQFAT